MIGIYRFKWSYEDKIKLEGLFMADSDVLKKIVGKTIRIDQYVPKYAGILLKLKEDQFSPVTSNASAIKVFEYFKLENGFNPLNYI